MLVKRTLKEIVQKDLRLYPAVVILGPRQVGKTTFVRHQLNTDQMPSAYLDLERPSDLIKLTDPERYLTTQADKRVILDEVQRMQQLLPLLRSLIDEDRKPGRFVLLGSASEDLIQLSSESLAGRGSYHEMHPFHLGEVGVEDWERLWLRGGFPLAFTALDEETAFRWLGNFVRTYIERELAGTALRTNASVLERFVRILSSIHGQLVNYNELARANGLTVPTVKKYLDFFERAYVLRMLRPYFPNVKKRLVKSTKLYIRDSGVLHYLRGTENREELLGNIVVGASWEGFVIQQILANLKPSCLPFFYRTSNGAELDLVILKGDRPYATFEIKFTNSPSVGKSMIIGQQDLQPAFSYIVTPSSDKFEIRKGIQVIPISDLLAEMGQIGILLQ